MLYLKVFEASNTELHEPTASEPCAMHIVFLIVLGYRLNSRGSRFQLLVGAGNFSLHHCVQNGSEAHPASYPIGTRGCFPGGKAAGA